MNPSGVVRAFCLMKSLRSGGISVESKMGISRVFNSGSLVKDERKVSSGPPLMSMEINPTGIKKGELFIADVSTQLKNKNITTDVKVDTNSRLFATVSINEPAPGLNAIFNFVVPYQRSGKMYHPENGLKLARRSFSSKSEVELKAEAYLRNEFENNTKLLVEEAARVDKLLVEEHVKKEQLKKQQLRKRKLRELRLERLEDMELLAREQAVYLQLMQYKNDAVDCLLSFGIDPTPYDKGDHIFINDDEFKKELESQSWFRRNYLSLKRKKLFGKVAHGLVRAISIGVGLPSISEASLKSE